MQQGYLNVQGLQCCQSMIMIGGLPYVIAMSDIPSPQGQAFTLGLSCNQSQYNCVQAKPANAAAATANVKPSQPSKPAPGAKNKAMNQLGGLHLSASDSESDDDVPLSQRRAPPPKVHWPPPALAAYMRHIHLHSADKA